MNEAVDLTQDLVQIESVSENEYEVMEYAQNWFNEYDVPNELDEFTVERGGEELDMYNLEVGDVENAEFLIAAHLDTTPLNEDDWEQSEALSGEIKGDRLYGRGSADTKSNAAAAMVAVRNAYEEYDDPNVALVLESDEEVGFEGAERFLDKYDTEDMNAEFTVMCEPEDLDIINEHKGLYHNEIQISRPDVDMSHASKAQRVDEDGEVYYQPGESAIQAAIPVLERLEEVKEYMQSLEPHEELGPVTFETTLVEGGSAINSVPQNVTIRTDSRIPPNYDTAELAEKTESMIEPLLGEHDSIETVPVKQPVKIDPNDPMVQEFKDAAEDGGSDGEISSMEAYTELGLYHDALGIPGVIFGTSPNEVIHNPDEYVDVDSISVVQDTFENMIERTAD